nr:hypothetical protein [Caulobacter sp. D4A]
MRQPGDMDERNFDPAHIAICQPADPLADDLFSDRGDLLDHDLRHMLKTIHGVGLDDRAKKRCFKQMRRQRTGKSGGVGNKKLVGLKNDGGPRFAKFTGKNRDHDVPSAQLHGLSQSAGPTASIQSSISSLASASAIRRISSSACLRKAS